MPSDEERLRKAEALAEALAEMIADCEWCHGLQDLYASPEPWRARYNRFRGPDGSCGKCYAARAALAAWRERRDG